MSTALHILIVDDEQIVHKTLGGFLRELGHLVDSAWDGNMGLDALKKNKYDLALIDVRMPGMDGLTLLKKVQEISPNLYVVIITGHGDPIMADKANELGAVDFLVKPISLIELQNIAKKATPSD